ncbi:conserved exported protein of unknown function [Sterolibacterium denitrificans]|uniref:MSHA biogenesis protein MshO n=1 Tax=Sterolibacterium denitrificans TaxID=157592 RepID=A0A7Z7HQR5_9PROT|nr:prepilin-type N-terminal cleavage/methylation domain-containing protein [Sterolibacterium denitrificans]SMB24123.1 conserved exported protein of unknown function [Sterolibacterium denitrificans]
MNMKPKPQLHRRPRQRGFTLIEMIMTMVMMAILAGITAVFISGPVKGYLDTVRRGDLMDTADLTLRRLADEIRMTLPNSLRITENGALVYIEFIPTIAGGAYLDEYSPPTAGSTKPLVYSDDTSCATVADNCKFDVVGAMPANPAIDAGDYIVVYNLGQDANQNRYAPADAYATGDDCSACNRAKVTDVTGKTVTLAANVFAQQAPPLPSPYHRFNVVPKTRAVTFVCPATGNVPGSLLRYTDYGFFATAAGPSGAIAALAGKTPAIVAERARCAVSYTASASQRNGLMSIRLTLFNAEGDESVSLMRQVHLDNTP